MRRSYSFNSLRTSEQEEDENHDDDDDVSIDDNESGSRTFTILRVPSKKTNKVYVNFSANCMMFGTPPTCLEMIKKYQLGYKFVKTECRLVRNILHAHGFKETPQNSIQFNLMWSGSHMKPYTLRSLKEHQKVNHFPRSYELTRKDRLYKSIQVMQHSKGLRHFDFIPQSFLLPTELNDFYSAFLKNRGPWIVKPCALSRGRGIYLVNHVNQIPLDETVLVCRYINNPLLINGYKFDCRIYVAVTSYDPLRIYIYEEGLARFTTVKYETAGSSTNLKNQWMHLTNYSLNKLNEDYVRCDDPEVDNYGSKWSFSAMLRHLKEKGIDTRALMARIEDVIVKTIISGEMAIATACKMFVPYSGNCFELFGFDIMVDDTMKPWLLEVNLSPSLACDAPMDLKIKSNLISDLFNMTGFLVEEPIMKKKRNNNANGRNKQRLYSANINLSEMRAKPTNFNMDDMSKGERKILWETKQEFKNKGGFVRVYPSPESWELYSSLQNHHTTNNRFLHSKLFPELWSSSTRPQSATYIARARNLSSVKPVYVADSCKDSDDENYHQRYVMYERKMAGWDNHDERASDIGSNKGGIQPETRLVQGELVNDERYEKNLLKTIIKASEPTKLIDIPKNAQYLSKFQAREAFAVYLQRVQHRLLQEIGYENQQPCRVNIEDMEKQEHQINLIHKFLMKAAVNLSNPINIIIPHQNLPLLERKKILARQLNDFIKVYRKETGILLERGDKEDQCIGSSVKIAEESFNTFIAISSEQELEEILTVYTKHNKSASIFLGAKSANRRHTTSDASDRESQQSGTRARVLSSSDALDRPKSSVNSLKRASAKTAHRASSATNTQDRRSHSRSASEPSTRIQDKTVRPSSSTTSSSNTKRDLRSSTRQHSAGSTRSDGRIRRSASRDSIDKISTMVCTYTGSNKLLHYHERQEVPKMKDALRQFSDKQSMRTYSARQFKTAKEHNEREEAIQKYQEFLKRNQKYFEKYNIDEENVISHPPTTVNQPASQLFKYTEPKPPSGKRPEIKKQLSAQRTFRTIIKK